MERKIGERFTENGKNYVVLESNFCRGCVFKDGNTCTKRKVKNDVWGECIEDKREDGKSVIFSIDSTDSFNLEGAKAGKPVCTKDGRKARIVCFDAKRNCPLVVLVEDDDDDEVVLNYTDCGQCIERGTNYDLVMVIEKKIGYFAIMRPCYDLSHLAETTAIFRTKREVEEYVANIGCQSDLIEIREIEW